MSTLEGVREAVDVIGISMGGGYWGERLSTLRGGLEIEGGGVEYGNHYLSNMVPATYEKPWILNDVEHHVRRVLNELSSA